MGIKLITPGTIGMDHIGLTDSIKHWASEASVNFSLRYMVPRDLAQWNKDVKQAEILWHAQQGMPLGPNWEVEAEEPLLGALKGQIAGKWLYMMALDFQIPVETPLWISVDIDVKNSNREATEAYVRAFASQIGNYRLGVYGDLDIINAVADLNPIGWLAAASFWSRDGGSEDHVYIQQAPQLDDVAVDPNVCVKPFYMWVPEVDLTWVPEFAYGYFNPPRWYPMAEIYRREKGYLALPEAWERNESFIREEGGAVSIGSGWRAFGAGTSPASAANRSFHQEQEFNVRPV